MLCSSSRRTYTPATTAIRTTPTPTGIILMCAVRVRCACNVALMSARRSDRDVAHPRHVPKARVRVRGANQVAVFQLFRVCAHTHTHTGTHTQTASALEHTAYCGRHGRSDCGDAAAMQPCFMLTELCPIGIQFDFLRSTTTTHSHCACVC